MNLPLVIGRNSSGEDYIINLKLLPHLFISYHEETQLAGTFLRMIGDFMNSNQSLELAVSLGRRLAKIILPAVDEKSILIQFTHSEQSNNIHSIDEFISALLVQLKNRKRLNKKLLHLKKSDTILIVFIDDIFEIIRSTHKKTALSFIELLVNGPNESIHIIAGSSGLYKNLLNQLINIRPPLKGKLKMSKYTMNTDQPLAAELIINPDGLVFFKEINGPAFIRLFPAQ